VCQWGSRIRIYKVKKGDKRRDGRQKYTFLGSENGGGKKKLRTRNLERKIVNKYVEQPTRNLRSRSNRATQLQVRENRKECLWRISGDFKVAGRAG